MPQDLVVGPFREPDLRAELRLHPVRLLVRRRPAAEWVRLDLERLEEREEARQLLFVEAGAHVTRIDERAALVHAQQQRAEVLARPSWLRPAGDDEFLFLDDLEFSPVGCALARDVPRRRQLRDEALPAARDRALVQRPPVAAGYFAQPQDRRASPPEQPLESLATLEQRLSAEVDVA